MKDAYKKRILVDKYRFSFCFPRGGNEAHIFISLTCIVGASGISVASVVTLAVENASYSRGGGHSFYDLACLDLRGHSVNRKGWAMCLLCLPSTAVL